MIIYVAHSTSFDFQRELYTPLENIILHSSKSFVFPHNRGTEIGHSKETIVGCDLVIAEVSYPSTGMGIELGWAEMVGIPIVAIHKHAARPSSSIGAVTTNIIAYDNIAEVVKMIIEAGCRRNV